MEAYHEDYAQVEAHIFDDRDSALKWLGIEVDSGLFYGANSPIVFLLT